MQCKYVYVNLRWIAYIRLVDRTGLQEDVGFKVFIPPQVASAIGWEGEIYFAARKEKRFNLNCSGPLFPVHWGRVHACRRRGGVRWLDKDTNPLVTHTVATSASLGRYTGHVGIFGHDIPLPPCANSDLLLICSLRLRSRVRTPSPLRLRRIHFVSPALECAPRPRPFTCL